MKKKRENERTRERDKNKIIKNIIERKTFKTLI
jgi:hypothetical protein